MKAIEYNKLNILQFLLKSVMMTAHLLIENVITFKNLAIDILINIV